MLAPSGGGLIIYQVYGNLYAITDRKAQLLEDKQILNVGVFDEVFCIWKAFGGNTRDLGSFGEKNEQDYGPTPTFLKIMFLAAGDGVITTDKIVQIKQRIQAAHVRQKSYADVRRKPLEFQVSNRVMLKVSPWKGVIRFGKQGKLNLRVHITLHVSNLKKCLFDEPLAIPLDEIHIDDKLYFVEEPVEIMVPEVKRLNQSHILIVKVRWNSRRGPEFAWERED
ncbi:hypothetical protein Tco_0901736 [Tanacetum coccineum]